MTGKHMLESRGGVAGQPVPEGGASGNPRGNGKIINISSLVAYQGTSPGIHVMFPAYNLIGGLNVVAYAAAKHGVQGIVRRSSPLQSPPLIDQVKSFSNGWAAKGVNVNAIAPGYISTDVRPLTLTPWMNVG